MNEEESSCSCFRKDVKGEEKENLKAGIRTPSDQSRKRPTKAMGGARWEKHGMTKSYPEYRTWRNMRYRCNCTSCGMYKYYGERGISVCPQWDSFTQFLYDMGQRPGPDYTLDRKNNDKGYCPHNCRWATYVQQNNNTRFNRKHGDHTTAELARIHGLTWACTDKRLKRGIPLTLPVGVSKHFLRKRK